MTERTRSGAEPREIRAWALYDFANSSFTTLVVTFIYSAWFAAAMADDVASGTRLWSRGMAASALGIALLAPLLGAAADRYAIRMRAFRSLTLAAIVGTTLLAFVPPPHALLALGIFVATNVTYELAGALYNAFLPTLATPERTGRVSANGWAAGYAGGLLCLIAGLVLVRGGWLDGSAGWTYRGTNLLVAGWFLVFSLPALLVLREPPLAKPVAALSLRDGWRRVRQYPHALRFLVARLVYNDGLVTIFAFGGIYARGVFDFELNDLLVFGIVLNVAAGLGAYAFGRVDDALGGKSTILITLIGLTLATILAVIASAAWQLWAAGILIGIMAGPNQSASRALLARFVPLERSAEFFGLYALSGKLTAFAAPLLIGEIAARTGSLRSGLAVLTVFFAAGGLLLLFVDEKAGTRLATSPATPT